jgi:aminopeptidase-like protein
MVSSLHALKASLDASTLPYRTGQFQSIIVNDEYIWENYGIPMTSLSRFPYPEYHSSFDTVDRISEVSLQEAVGVLMDAIDRLESAPLLIKKFQGNICLSNPRYDLYIDSGQVALGDNSTDTLQRMRRLMDFIPALDRPVSVKAIADQMGLPESDTLAYLRRWSDKGLIDLL